MEHILLSDTDEFNRLIDPELLFRMQNFDNGDSITQYSYTIDYKLNSYGYRSNEFSENTDIVFLGCSNTFGYGLEQEFMWSNIVSKKLNLSSANLACLGDSVEGQVQRVFDYFNYYGHPKIICGIFPGDRITIASKKGFFEESELPRTEIYPVTIKDNEISKYSKIPHKPSQIIPVQHAIYNSFTFIRLLEAYCKSNNILFIWSIWSGEYENMIDVMAKRFSGFVPLDSDVEIEECNRCIDYIDHLLYYSAADMTKYPPHWGIHKNIHYSNNILNKLYTIGIK